MNAADQIEMLTGRTVGALTRASREFTGLQRALTDELDRHRRGHLDEHRRGHGDDTARLRRSLTDAADACDNVTPRIMLPADMSEASPHRSDPNE